MGGQPPTAAIVVAAIFGTLAALFFSYRIYKKVWNHRHKDEILPPVKEPPTAYYGQTPVTPMTQMSPYFFGGGASASKGSSIATPSPVYGGAATPSELPSPSTPAADSLLETGTPDGFDSNGRGYSTISSSSSTMTLKRSYASGQVKPSSASVHSALSSFSTGRRESYLPHSPLNRDSIQIVPPQPLGFGFGGFATATDQRTLAFSQMSGIGSGDEFGSGLVWASNDPSSSKNNSNSTSNSNGNINSTSISNSNSNGNPGSYNSSRRSSKANVGEEERRKYLREGPSSSHRSYSPAVTPSTRSIMSSRALSPTSSSIAPHSVSMKGNSSQSQSSHSSEYGSGRSDSRPVPSGIDARSLDETKSPLQRVVSDRLPVPHERMPSEAPSLETDASGSPILGAFPATGLVGSRPSPHGSNNLLLRSHPSTSDERPPDANQV